MTSVGFYAMIFWFVLIAAISIPGLIFADASSFTYTNNKNIVCPILPFNISNPPDVWLNVPNLSVDEISLVVEDLKAHVSLSANVASLVSLNTGVDVSIDRVNLTIKGVKAQVQLAVHLDNIMKIIARTMTSLDLNPSLISVTDGVFETINNLLGIFTDNGQLIHQIINSVGKIVNQVVGPKNEILSSTIVGNYQQNMTLTGISRTLENGYVIKQYTYSSPSESSKTESILINVLYDAFGNILNTNVVNPPSILPTPTPTTITDKSTVTSTANSSSTQNAEK